MSRRPRARGAFWGRLAAAPLLVVLVVLAAAPSAARAAEPSFPTLTGRIVDNARLLKPDDLAAITADLAALEAKATDQLVVVTLPSLEGYAIDDYGYRLGRHWGIGQAGKNNGVLLIVAPNERKVRFEVGRGLEPVMTDALSKLIIENAILPAFRRGDFSAGIRAGVRDAKDVLLGDAEAVKERARVEEIDADPDWLAIALILFWITIVVVIIWAQVRQAQSQQQSGRRNVRRSRNDDDGPVFVPAGDSGSWSGGGWSSDSGGGGWSGGGGDFGGGGASGSW